MFFPDADYTGAGADGGWGTQAGVTRCHHVHPRHSWKMSPSAALRPPGFTLQPRASAPTVLAPPLCASQLFHLGSRSPAEMHGSNLRTNSLGTSFSCKERGCERLLSSPTCSAPHSGVCSHQPSPEEISLCFDSVFFNKQITERHLKPAAPARGCAISS